ncbi:hypothetical protein [Floridanema aerugineum]|uniref:5'-3' exonuclease domain-containing protein n=1 Tax=Floridaenema aerugineum BLCC-F46 TaxID=3153654 RepID=A0ABV4X272_9CYAN
MQKTRHTTVVFDYSVFCHQLHAIVGNADIPKKHYLGVIKAQLVQVLSQEYLGVLKPNEKFQTVFCVDSKPYWRTEYLLRPEVWEKVERYGKKGKLLEPQPIHYKAGRKFPEYTFTKLKNKMLEVIQNQGWSVMAGQGFEADDMAACIVMCNRILPPEKQHRLILVTVDTDWLGLLDNNTEWFCMKGWFPRVRMTLDDLNHWSHKRLGTYFDMPAELWGHKAVFGDKSDNLPPNSPLEVIDLCEPPAEFCSWELSATRNKAMQFLQYPADHSEKYFTDSASRYLMQLGMPKAIRPLDVGKDCLPALQSQLGYYPELELLTA